jgi:hypothetical protein
MNPDKALRIVRTEIRLLAIAAADECIRIKRECRRDVENSEHEYESLVDALQQRALDALCAIEAGLKEQQYGRRVERRREGRRKDRKRVDGQARPGA